MNRGWFAHDSEVRNSRVVFWSRHRAPSIVGIDQAGRLGSDGRNLRLSERRSQSVKEYLGPIANAESIVD